MSIKDLIWVNAAQAAKLEREFKLKADEAENRFKTAETLYLALCDIREVSRDTNLQMRMLVACKLGQKRVKAFDPKELPSIRIPEEKEEAERMAKMTPEELRQKQIDDFMAGKQIVL